MNKIKSVLYEIRYILYGLALGTLLIWIASILNVAAKNVYELILYLFIGSIALFPFIATLDERFIKPRTE